MCNPSTCECFHPSGERDLAMPLVPENWSTGRNSSPGVVLACTQTWEECHDGDGQS
jgi:hypothetical protein